MRPKIKQKRIDPRYFLNETTNRGELEEIEPNPSPVVKVNIAPLPSPETEVEEHEKSNDQDNDGVPDSKDKGGTQLLKGEKSLYEKIRGAIEEVYNEYLEEK
jgi:hypothetical protein